MPKNSCIMQIWAESGKSALPICNYSQILYQFLTFTQNLKRSLPPFFNLLSIFPVYLTVHTEAYTTVQLFPAEVPRMPSFSAESAPLRLLSLLPLA